MQKFATPAPIAAVLDIPAGRVQLIAADRADTTVDIRPATPGRRRDVQTAEQTTVTYADGVLTITTPKQPRQLLGPGAIEVTVQLPAGSRVDGRSAASELRGVGRLGELTFDGAHHHIKIDEAARVTLTAVDGDVVLGRLTGPADITTTRGDIRISDAVRGALTLTTQQGDIDVTTTPGASATLSAGTSYGRVSNALKNNGTPDLTIEATTTHGDITAQAA
ncbi:hypothetical protein ACTI_71110 [Actinoplanes sp. OR16]|uniref:DUF4097 family beta strand repeat-containing protein n=1 Tax=Actinoplanes sp. OR16 TaxID=946334 RepID=UPI000F7148E0|nr:DUF4097 family beta strand repeat-containing protein [Actinoplanes sp. OR16]BBH70426.1 hypothetical protein ACTI_71110 [Actinoplanes sp. OR16]